MVKFCPECPLRGECVEEIAYVDGGDFETTCLNTGIIPRFETRLVFLDECIDVDGNHSKLFMGVDTLLVKDMLEGCEGPTEVKVKGFIPFTKSKIRACGALGVGANVPVEYAEHYRREQARIQAEEQ